MSYFPRGRDTFWVGLFVLTASTAGVLQVNLDQASCFETLSWQLGLAMHVCHYSLLKRDKLLRVQGGLRGHELSDRIISIVPQTSMHVSNLPFDNINYTPSVGEQPPPPPPYLLRVTYLSGPLPGALRGFATFPRRKPINHGLSVLLWQSADLSSPQQPVNIYVHDARNADTTYSRMASGVTS